MFEIKRVLTDLDGTVAELGQHVISEGVRQAVIECEQKGVKLNPVTGRYFKMAQPVLEVLGFEGLGIFDNGASIMDIKTGEIVWSKWLDTPVVRQVASILVPASKALDFTPDHNVHEPTDNELERIENLAESTSHVFGLVRRDHIEVVKKQLNAIGGIGYYVAADLDGDDNYLGVQVNHEAANKFHGAEALRTLQGIPIEQTMAIGDGDNDLPLFANAGLKIAMGNATEALKAQADYVVADVYHDGFREAMERFVLGKRASSKS